MSALAVFRRQLAPAIVAALLAAAAATSAEGGTAPMLEARLGAGMPQQARWALAVRDLSSGREILTAGNATEQPLVPASLVKLLVAGAALDSGMLPMRTRVFHDGALRKERLQGNIYLLGGGNALLSAQEIGTLAAAVAAKGIREVAGDVVADATLFDTRGLERSRSGPGYAPPAALGVDLHTVAVTVTPTEAGLPPTVTVEPANGAVRIAVAARTAQVNSGSIRVTRIDDLAYRAEGNIARDGQPFRQRFPLQEPSLYAAGVLEGALRQAGVKVTGHATAGKAPGAAILLAEAEGSPLRETLEKMNVNSLNVVADNLLLLLGGHRYGAPGTREKGIAALHQFLSALGLPGGEAAIADGSGLRGENRISARYLTQYLGRVAGQRWFRDFRETLPRAGVDGTLREIGYRNESFRVKSGRLEDAFALAGYGVDINGREIAFAFLVNVPGAAVMGLERSGAEVMKYLGTEVMK